MNEADIEQLILLPLLAKLGWSRDEIHPKVPVNFRQGTKVGRKPEADFAMAAASPRPPTRAYLVAEAKSSNDSMDTAGDQAFSYAQMLRSPFYICTNGEKTKIWKTGYLRDSILLVELNSRSELDSRFGEIAINISKESIFDWIAKNLQDESKPYEPDLKDYVSYLGQLTIQTPLIPRMLEKRGETPQKIIVSADMNTEFPFATDRWNHICGLGGRGKSTILLLVARRVLRGGMPGRIPVLLPFRYGEGSLFERLAASMHSFCPALSDAATVAVWVRRTPIVLLLDDWEQLSGKDRGLVEREIDSLSLANCMVISVGRLGVAFPRSAKLVVYDVDRFLPEEANDLIKKRLDASNCADFMRAMPPALRSLVNEPVILDKLLDLSFSGTLSPQLRLPEVFNELMHKMLASRHDNLSERVEQLNAVCRQISSAGSLNRQTIMLAINMNGLSLSTDDVINELISISILRRPLGAPGALEFSHPIWRSYFVVQSLFEPSSLQAGERPVEDKLASWLSQRRDDDKRQDLYFLLGMLRSGHMRQLVLDFLMKHDIELYLQGIQTDDSEDVSNKSFDSSREILQRYYKGYFSFLEVCCPELRPLLSPWKDTVDIHSSTREHGKLIGFMSGKFLTYVKTLTDNNRDTIIVDPEVGIHRNYHAESLVEFSAIQTTSLIIDEPVRKLAMKEILRQIIGTFEQTSRRQAPLPVFDAKWLVIERLVDAMKHAAQTVLYDVTDKWSNLTPSRVLEWARRNERSTNGRLNAIHVCRNSVIENSRIIITEIARDAERLISLGLSDTTLHNLCLPGPDWKQSSEEGPIHFDYCYSDRAAVKYAEEFFAAFVATYKDVCEKYFPIFVNMFLFRVGPFKAVVEIDPVPADPASMRSGWQRRWSYWFEPTEKWGEPPEVSIGSGSEIDYDKLEYRFRNKCANLDRPSLELSLTSSISNWAPYSPQISALLSATLGRDLHRILQSEP